MEKKNINFGTLKSIALKQRDMRRSSRDINELERKEERGGREGGVGLGGWVLVFSEKTYMCLSQMILDLYQMGLGPMDSRGV